ncbi:hypothetical protein [Pseudarthrobacter sp. H3Y2-7]|uniref:hypothetical protein n=1 Tax=Pseudarthrobacter naphthalenicus TaxID=3031328 RepID=UPI0023B1160A|nr:hypothetical protein [Pseudarthrobacter sp. H3Y2-7]
MSETDGPELPPATGPRHMRKRRFRREVPDELLPGGRALAEPVSPRREDSTGEPEKPNATSGPASRSAGQRRKRLVALCVVILVALSIPALALLLIFAG